MNYKHYEPETELQVPMVELRRQRVYENLRLRILISKGRRVKFCKRV
jgi:hypothetical protein